MSLSEPALSNVRQRIRLPDFLIVGAAKCGTTTIYDEIGRHPQVRLPTNKEPAILHFATSVDDALKLYNRHFSGLGRDVVTGEASTAYTQAPQQKQVHDLAKDVFNSDCKIIYCVRDPIDRIRSHLMHDLTVGRLCTDDIDSAVLDDSRYIAWTNYRQQLSPWIDAFGEENVLCLSLERLKSDREYVISAVFDHLGLRKLDRFAPPQKSNAMGSIQTPRLKFLADIQTSRIYNTTVSRLVPNRIKHLAKKTLFQRHIPDAFALNENVLAKLRAKTENFLIELNQLNVKLVI